MQYSCMLNNNNLSTWTVIVTVIWWQSTCKQKVEMSCYCAKNHALKLNNDDIITTVEMSSTIILCAFNVSQLSKGAGIDFGKFCLLRRQTQCLLLWQVIMLTTIAGDITCFCLHAEPNGPPVSWTQCPNTAAVTWTPVPNNAGCTFCQKDSSNK